MNHCIFCKIASGEVSSEKIYENDNFFSIFDVSPQIKGHALVISKKHFKTLLDMPNTLSLELMDCIKTTSLKLMKDFFLKEDFPNSSLRYKHLSSLFQLEKE